MIISLCVPCMNRTYDLKKVMPSWIKAANASPPVEIVVLDYNSQDDLQEYVDKARDELDITSGNRLICPKYDRREYFHMAHARNLSVLSSAGDYVVCSCADIGLAENFFEVVRSLINTGAVWMRPSRYRGVVVVKREEFIDAGGYDERFEFYGPEDNDLEERLFRRKGKFAEYPWRLLDPITTLKEDKFKNYRIKSRLKIKNAMRPFYEENKANQVLRVNKDGWGKWE